MEWGLIKFYSEIVKDAYPKNIHKKLKNKIIKPPILINLEHVPHFKQSSRSHPQFSLQTNRNEFLPSSNSITPAVPLLIQPPPIIVQTEIQNVDPPAIEIAALNIQEVPIQLPEFYNSPIAPLNTNLDEIPHIHGFAVNLDEYLERFSDVIPHGEENIGGQPFENSNELQVNSTIIESELRISESLLHNSGTSERNEDDISPEVNHPQISWDGSFSWDEAVENLNKKVFKNPKFKPNQREIINAVLSNRDVFGCLPTGGGKSLTFQLPSLVMQGITIVIMPLLSLISDQYSKLISYNIPARVVKDLNLKEKQLLFHEIVTQNSIRILLITPEFLIQSSLMRRLLLELDARKSINFFVIDEAHCILSYGKDFRPDFSKLDFLRKDFPDIPILCLTGSITAPERKDIIDHLKIHPVVISASSYRSNLNYEVIPKEKNGISQLASLIKTRFPDQTGIIFLNDRKKCEEYSKNLTEMYSLPCRYFHAELSKSAKDSLLEEWQEGRSKVIIATNAFGMGIDNALVRFVIHYKVPKSISEFYQESGRAGRALQEASCIIMYNIADRRSLYYFLNNCRDDEGKREGMRNIYEMLEFCEDLCTCRKKKIANYFGEKQTEDCRNMCDNCRLVYSGGISIKEKNLTVEAQKILDFVNSDDCSQIRLTFSKLTKFFSGKLPEYKSTHLYGQFKFLLSGEVDRIILRLLQLGYLYERIQIVSSNQVHTYLYPSEDKQRIAEEDQVILRCHTYVLPNIPERIASSEEIYLSSDDEVIEEIIRNSPTAIDNGAADDDLMILEEDYGRCKTKEAFDRLGGMLIRRAIELEIDFESAHIKDLCRKLPQDWRSDDPLLEVIAQFLNEGRNDRNAINIEDDELAQEMEVVYLPCKRGRNQ